MNTIFKPNTNRSGHTSPSEKSGFTYPAHPEPNNHPIDALRDGDEAAFSKLMTLYYDAMLRLALIYVKDPCVAEDVIQETWMAVLRGLTRFEGRSSLKTWIFSILTNRAITRAHREGRYVSLSDIIDADYDEFESTLTSDDFSRPSTAESAFHWQVDNHPNTWEVIPEDSLLAQETLAHIHAAIRLLPTLQQQVILMRDVEGWSATEVCDALAVSEINQRVLLHRARAKVRQIVGRYLQVD